MNWRQIFKSPQIDVCAFERSVNKLPFYKAFLDDYRRLYPEMPSKCPIKPGRYYVYNHTEDYENGQSIPLAELIMRLPNGQYRAILLLTSRNDPLIIRLDWQREIYKRLGEDRF